MKRIVLSTLIAGMVSNAALAIDLPRKLCKENAFCVFETQEGILAIRDYYDYDHYSQFRLREGAGYCEIAKNGEKIWIDTKGNVVKKPANRTDHNNSKPPLEKSLVNGKYGYINADGKLVIPAKYDQAHEFQLVISPNHKTEKNKPGEYFAAVAINGKWGFINSSGVMVIPAKYDAIDGDDFVEFSGGLVGVKLNGKLIYVNTQGREHSSLVYKVLKQSSSGDEFLLRISLVQKSDQQLYLEAGKLERNGDSYKAGVIYNYIIDNFPSSPFSIKASDQLNAKDRSSRTESAARDADYNARQRAYNACKIEINSCYSRTNGKGNCYRDCDSLR